MVAPVNAGAYSTNKTLNTISGTADDPSPGTASRVDEVYIRLSSATVQYWDSDAQNWTTSTDKWKILNGSETWDTSTHTLPVPWEENITYTVNTKAKDRAGNYETTITTVNFTYDI